MTQPADLWWSSRRRLVSNSQAKPRAQWRLRLPSAPPCVEWESHTTIVSLRFKGNKRLSLAVDVTRHDLSARTHAHIHTLLFGHTSSFMSPCHTSLRFRFQWGYVQKHLGPNSHSACRQRSRPSPENLFSCFVSGKDPAQDKRTPAGSRALFVRRTHVGRDKSRRLPFSDRYVPVCGFGEKTDGHDFPSVSCLCNSHVREVEVLDATLIYAGRLLYSVSLFYERGCDASGRTGVSD